MVAMAAWPEARGTAPLEFADLPSLHMYSPPPLAKLHTSPQAKKLIEMIRMKTIISRGRLAPPAPSDLGAPILLLLSQSGPRSSLRPLCAHIYTHTHLHTCTYTLPTFSDSNTLLSLSIEQLIPIPWSLEQSLSWAGQHREHYENREGERRECELVYSLLGDPGHVTVVIHFQSQKAIHGSW